MNELCVLQLQYNHKLLPRTYSKSHKHDLVIQQVIIAIIGQRLMSSIDQLLLDCLLCCWVHLQQQHRVETLIIVKDCQPDMTNADALLTRHGQ